MLLEDFILIADDHSMIRKGLKLHLQLDLGRKNIDEVQSCQQLMAALLKNNYTHLILDIILADGSSMEVLPNIRRLYPKLKILVFSMQPTDIYGEALKQYGINYYLNKTATDDEVLVLLKAFLDNKTIGIDSTNNTPLHNPFTTVTPRELEILHYLLKGLGTKQIADTLNLQMSTVSTLKARILEKTGSKNTKDLLETATLYNINY